MYVPRIFYLKSGNLNKNVNLNSETLETSIPCMYIPYKNGLSSKLIIFFHANAEDIFISYDFIYNISKILKINILVPEYPSYSIYKTVKSEKKE